MLKLAVDRISCLVKQLCAPPTLQKALWDSCVTHQILMSLRYPQAMAELHSQLHLDIVSVLHSMGSRS